VAWMFDSAAYVCWMFDGDATYFGMAPIRSLTGI